MSNAHSTYPPAVVYHKRYVLNIYRPKKWRHQSLHGKFARFYTNVIGLRPCELKNDDRRTAFVLDETFKWTLERLGRNASISIDELISDSYQAMLLKLSSPIRSAVR